MTTETNNPEEAHGADRLEMPAPTLWPLVLAAAVVLLGAGFVTNWFFTIVGAVVFVIALANWISVLLPGRGEVEEELAPPEQRPQPVRECPEAVEQLRPGMAGHRMRVPEKIHPYSAGARGGLIGAFVMPIPALVYGLLSHHHSLWYPVNLLVGMVVPLPQTPDGQLDVAALEQFRLIWFVGALFIHAILSVSLGLMYGVLLPMLPGRPIIWGGVVAPLLWTGSAYGFMGVLNPALASEVYWPAFVLSQFVYGITVSIVVERSEKVYAEDVGNLGLIRRGAADDADTAAGGGRMTMPPRARTWTLGLALLALLPLTGCDDNAPGKPALAQVPKRPGEEKDFGALFDQNCRACHGPNGKGGPAPPLNDKLFLHIVPDETLQMVIAGGRKGTLMPAFAASQGGSLTDEQVQILAEGLKGHWGKEKSKLDVPIPAYELGELAATSAEREARITAGKETFRVACATCHGDDGKGGERAGPLAPVALRLLSKQALRRVIITGRPDLKIAMPNFAEDDYRAPGFKPLTGKQVGELVELLVSWREAGMGAKE